MSDNRTELSNKPPSVFDDVVAVWSEPLAGAGLCRGHRGIVIISQDVSTSYKRIVSVCTRVVRFCCCDTTFYQFMNDNYLLHITYHM